MRPRYNATAASSRIWFEDGSSASRIIDLANGPGEPEPQVSITPLAPGLSRLSTPRQPIRIGHTAGNVRSADRIYTDGAVIPPKDARLGDRVPSAPTAILSWRC